MKLTNAKERIMSRPGYKIRAAYKKRKELIMKILTKHIEINVISEIIYDYHDVYIPFDEIDDDLKGIMTSLLKDFKCFVKEIFSFLR